MTDLISLIKQSGKGYDVEKIQQAYEFAAEAHAQQRRKSGEPYIIHPIATARILVDLGMDTDSIVAALLHDVVEDTDCTLEMVEDTFGKEVALLVNGVTKLGKIPYSSREEQQAENVRKMLLAMAQDVRVIIIKLADRLHNMRTLGSLPEQKQRDKAHETLEVYAPLADRLGITAVKEELEDISLKVLDPIAYQDIDNMIALKNNEGTAFIEKIKSIIRERLSSEYDNIFIEGRVKSHYGIYRKIYIQGKLIDEIYDIYAVRIIVDTVLECYNILGVIHDMFIPIPNRFKDYISTPKQNMYQSLHTTVISKDGIPFEIQIRTWDMHHTAEYGIAAHWKYKAGVAGKDKLEDRLAWVRQLLEAQKESEDVRDIVRSIKTDIAPEEVFVFTPKGDVIRIPSGSTVIDFAYAIHTEIGNRMVGAKVNGRIVPIDFKVQTGMIVEIITSNKSNGPSRDWLKIVRTNQARNKIRAWFKKERREENIAEGRMELSREFRRNFISLPDAEMEEFILDIAKKQHFQSTDDFLAAIGYGGVQLSRIMPRIKENYIKTYKTTDEMKLEKALTKPKRTKSANNGVVVEDLDNCLVKFARCCNPVPGDPIIGFVTRGYGVSIHKQDCINVKNSMKDPEQAGRWLNAYWEKFAKETFKSSIDILATQRDGLIMDISVTLSNMHIPIHSLVAREIKDHMSSIQITMSISDLDQLNQIITNVKKIKGVVNVERYTQ